MLTTTSAREEAFGMIELLVTMVLLAVALAMVSTFLLGSWKTAKHTTATGRAQAKSTQLLNQFGADVRGAIGPDRSSVNVDRETLRIAVAGKVGLDPALKIDDVVKATSNELWVYSDAVDDGAAGRECVGYVDGPQGLTRSVYPAGSACPSAGAPSESVVLLKPRHVDPTTPLAPRFTYVVEYNPDVYVAGAGALIDVGHCQRIRDVSFDGATPTAIPGGPASSTLRNRIIVGVQINASAHELGGEVQFGTGTDGVDSSFAVLSRETKAYQYALGCSY